MKGREFQEWTEAEVAEWPGASVRFEMRGKHNSAVLSFGDAEQFVTFPATPGDGFRAVYNHVADVRRVLGEMGAARSEPRKSERKPSKRNPGAKERSTTVGERAPIMGDPWEALRELAAKPLRITEPGLYFDMACEDYFADPCPEPSLSNSGIGILLNQSPLHFAAQHPRLNGGIEARKASAAMHRGSVVHRLALGAGKDYAIIDSDAYRTNDAKAARDEAEAAGKCPILAHKFEEAEAQAKVLRQHLDDVLMGEPFLPEVVLVWQIETKHGLIWCRGMIDAWCPTLKMAVDLKSTPDASPTAATRRMVNGGYDMQDAWYSRGLGHVIGEPGKVRFVTLFSENDPPFASHAVTIDEAWRSSSWDLCEEAADIFAGCLKAKQWPGYPRTPQRLSPPDWLISQRMFRGFAREGHAELNDDLALEAAQ